MTSTSIDAIAKGDKQRNPSAQFSDFIDRFKPQMALALPRHLNVDRVTRLAVTEFSKNPQLQKCEPLSIVACVLQGVQSGLEIGVGGQAYMVPYWDNKRRQYIATFIPGWRGLLDLVNRAGRASAWTGAVHAGDRFDYAYGDRPFITHKPADDDDEAREMLYAYACGRVRGADWPVVEVWSMAKVWRHRDKYNKVGERHYSYANPEMYARKIPLLQVIKYLPQSVEIQHAMAHSYAADAGERVPLEGEFAEVLDAIGGDDARSYTEPAGESTDPQTGEITRTAQAGAATDATPRDPVKQRSHAQIADFIQKGPQHTAELVLDEARSYLPAEQYLELSQLYSVRWGNK